MWWFVLIKSCSYCVVDGLKCCCRGVLFTESVLVCWGVKYGKRIFTSILAVEEMRAISLYEVPILGSFFGGDCNYFGEFSSLSGLCWC